MLTGYREKGSLGRWGRSCRADPQGLGEAEEEPEEARAPPSGDRSDSKSWRLPFRKVAPSVAAPRGGSLTELREHAVCGVQALSLSLGPQGRTHS